MRQLRSRALALGVFALLIGACLYANAIVLQLKKAD